METLADVYALPQEILDFRAAISQICVERVAPRAAAIDETAEYPWDVRELFAEHDILGLPFPTEYGGTGTGTLMLNVAIEEIAKSCASSALILMVQELGTLPIQLFGTEVQKQRFLPRCATGEWSPAFALSEPEAGSDPGGMITTARPDGDDWVISGTKNWITNLGVADFYIVFAVTDRENRRITAFIVEADRPGFSIGKLEHKLGIRGSPTGQPIFDDVRVGPETSWARSARASRSPSPPWSARDSAPAPRRSGWRRAPPTMRWATPVSAGSSAARSTPSRRSSSSWPRWSSEPPLGASSSTGPARWPTGASPAPASTPRWRRCSAPTRRCT